jgi:hypothetical protein
MQNHSLVQRLFDGDLDIVGDIHGEIEALHSLLECLEYNSDGSHPSGRRLVFLGDLTDRGPDSIAVVELVQQLVQAGSAQCVLGNHDLNILLEHKKSENEWFFHDKLMDEQRQTLGQRLATPEDQQRIREFFATLPLALERGDLRVVHACWSACCVPAWKSCWDGYWNRPAIDIVREHDNVKTLYKEYESRIKNDISGRGLDGTDTKLHHQNRNPVKLITSGPEERTDEPFMAGGRLRRERRVEWWKDYSDIRCCVFGHYASPPGKLLGSPQAICVDYGVGKRSQERKQAGEGEAAFRHKLAALRFPDMELVFDDGVETQVPES